MKKFFASIVMMLLAAPSFAQYSSGGFSLNETSTYYGVRFGMNISNFTGDVNRDSKVGMNLAGIIGLRVSQSTPVFLESGLYYSGRGAKKLSANYLEIPLLIKYGFKATDDIAVLPFFGPYFGLGIAGKAVVDHDDDGSEIKQGSFKNVLSRGDMGFKVGVGAEYNMLYLEAGYQFGVTNAVKNSDDYSAHTSNVFINFGVNF